MPLRPNPHYPIRVYTRWMSHGETKAYRGPLLPQPLILCADREERHVVSAKTNIHPAVKYLLKEKEMYLQEFSNIIKRKRIIILP